MADTIVVTGGTGFIGTALCRNLAEDYTVVVPSRSGTGPAIHPRVSVVPWDARSPAELGHCLEGVRAVVNLAGENIASSLRWTEEKKNRIIASRRAAAQALAEAVAHCSSKPETVVQASAIGFYGSRNDETLDEESPPGSGFLARTAIAWEESAQAIAAAGVRVPLIRTGIVLGRGGGFLSRVLVPFRLFTGGHPGSGCQWLSWIHMEDEIRAIRFLIEQSDLSGPVNLTAPGSLPAKDFFATLGRVMHRPSWLHPPAVALRCALGELADELLLSGQRVQPRRLIEAGFQFTYPELQPALENILND